MSSAHSIMHFTHINNLASRYASFLTGLVGIAIAGGVNSSIRPAADVEFRTPICRSAADRPRAFQRILSIPE